MKWILQAASVAAVVATLIAGIGAGIAQTAQTQPDNHDRIVRILDGIRLAGPPPWDPNEPAPGDGTRPEPVFDQSAPALAMRRAQTVIQRLLAASDDPVRFRLAKADRALADAWRAFVDGGSSDSRRRLSGTEHLQSTQRQLLRTATALRFADTLARDPVPELTRLKSDVAAISARIATDIYDIAVRAGVSVPRLRPTRRLLDLAARAEDDGRYVAAVAFYGGSTVLSGGTIAFDIDQFAQNIGDALNGETIGYTYAITLFETVHTSVAVGDARIPPDVMAPEPQATGKEMMVASVSKTLTTILVLRLLEMNGLSVDDPIGPWLPPEWDIGDGVAAQTFRDFLTHQTGFTQKGVDPDGNNTLAFLKNAVGIDVPANTGHDYNNANFGLFRVLVPRLAGFDFDAFAGYSDEELYAGFFVYAALNFFENVDISVTCNPSQPGPTIYYSHPHNGFNGLQPTDFSLECGGYGFFASVVDLAPILADLTAGDDLITDESVSAMKEGQLGFFDPANGYVWGNGGLGLYHNHGGDWEAGIKGLDTCIMLFPNGVTATLLINSIGGNYGGAGLYQCEVLRAAFDDAWEAS